MDISINSVKSQHYVVYMKLMLPGVSGLFVCFKSLGEMWQGHCRGSCASESAHFWQKLMLWTPMPSQLV